MSAILTSTKATNSYRGSKKLEEVAPTFDSVHNVVNIRDPWHRSEAIDPYKCVWCTSPQPQHQSVQLQTATTPVLEIMATCANKVTAYAYASCENTLFAPVQA